MRVQFFCGVFRIFSHGESIMNRKTPQLIVLSALLTTCAAAQDNGEKSVYLSLEGAPGSAADAASPAAQQFTIKKRDIKLNSPDTVSEVLELDPEISFKKGGAPGLMELAGLRGFASKNTAVLFNGKRIAPDATGTEDLSLINPAAIDGIQVFAGPVSPLYGANAEGGVINVMTTGTDGPARADLGGSISDFNTGSGYVSVSGGAGPLRTAVSGTRQYSAGFQQNGDYSGAGLNVAANFTEKGFGSVKLEAMGSSQTNGVPGGTPVPISQWDGSKERQANSLTDRQAASRSLMAATYTSPGNNPVAITAETWTSFNDITAWQYGSANQARTSLNTARLTAAFYQRSALSVQYERDTIASADPSEYGYGNHSIDTKAASVETRVDLSDTIELSGGLRFESASRWPDQASPRAVLTWKGPGWKASLSAGRAWQAPTFADMFNPWAPSNPNLKPEHSWQYAAGVERETLSGWTAKATAFYSQIDDKIALDPDNGYAAYNLDRGRITGVEPQIILKTANTKHSLACALIYSSVKPAGSVWQRLAHGPFPQQVPSTSSKA